MDIRRYKKLIAFGVGMAVNGLTDHLGIKFPWGSEQVAESITEGIVVIGTGVAIYFARNAPASAKRPGV